MLEQVPDLPIEVPSPPDLPLRLRCDGAPAGEPASEPATDEPGVSDDEAAEAEEAEQQEADAAAPEPEEPVARSESRQDQRAIDEAEEHWALLLSSARRLRTNRGHDGAGHRRQIEVVLARLQRFENRRSEPG